MKITDNAGDPKFLRDWNLFVWEATAGNWLWDLHRTEQEASRVGGSLVCCCILRGNPADSTRNPQMSREYRGDGNGSCWDPAGMEFVFLGEPREDASEILHVIKILVQALEY